MKHLFLLRHAEAGSSLGIEDHERPLTSRGRGDAHRVGTLLAGAASPPELALCSSARRARETLEAIRSHVAPPPRVEVERGLYLAGPDELLGRLAEVDGDVTGLLLVAHNPAIAELASRLARAGDEVALARLSRGVPAGTLATFRHEGGGWDELGSGRPYLVGLVVPRDLR